MARSRGTDAGRDWVAVVLAIGIATAINTVTAAVFYDAVRSDTPGLSENATQLLTTAFGGIVGVLGGYLGGRAVERASRERDETGGAGRPPAPGSSASTDEQVPPSDGPVSET